MNHKLKIQEHCIQILSPLDNIVAFTIWEEDFERYNKAFQESKEYKKEMYLLRKKHEELI